MTVTKRVTRYVKELTAPEPSKRRAAAEALAGADERALYPLIKALSDDNAGVQDAAMRSLISIGGEVTAYMVLPLLRSGPYLRNTARVILRAIGREAVPLLRQLLRDKDDDVRKFSVDLIGEIGWCDYHDDVVALLRQDPNPNVRASAARVLGLFGYGKALPELIQALTDDEWVCFSALEALAAIGDDTAAVALESILTSPSEAVRYGALEALGRLTSPLASNALMGHLATATGMEKRLTLKSLVQAGITPHMFEVSEMLLDMLRGGDWEEKLIAARGLVDLRDETALPHLADVAGSLDRSDPASEDRLCALTGTLAAFGCGEALTGLLTDPLVRYRGKVVVAEVLGILKCAPAVPDLAVLMNSAETEVRRAGATALAAIDCAEARQALMQALSDEDGHVRTTVVASLGRTGEKDAFNAILDLLASERHADVIRESVRALVSIDEAAFIDSLTIFDGPIREAAGRWLTDTEALLMLSRDEDPRVRASAVDGLGRTRLESVAGRLVEALGDPDPDVRRAAVGAMGEIGCCYEWILSAFDDSDTWVRVAAIKGTRAFSEPGLVPRLMDLSADPAVPVALAALETLAAISDRDGFSALTVFADHPDPDVRNRAEELLERT